MSFISDPDRLERLARYVCHELSSPRPNEIADALNDAAQRIRSLQSRLNDAPQGEELTPPVGYIGPRFVEFTNGANRAVAVNPEHVAAVSEFAVDAEIPNAFCTLVSLDGRYITDAAGTLAEVVAKLTGSDT